MAFLNGILPKLNLSSLTDALVYFAIAAVTVIGVFKCLIPLWGTTRALRRAVWRLEKEPGAAGERPAWQESRFMGRRLRGAWLRFLQNAEQLDRRGLPCNVEDYINDDTVTHGPGNATLAELIPNLLTSLGILGTFMGMMQGLTDLNMGDSEALMNSIPNLLQGMRFAFGTSVAGISCSLVFNIINRISQGSSYRAIDDFTEAFTQLAMRRPLDNDVQLICQNQDSNHMLQTVTEGLPQQLASTVGSALTMAMQPVTQSMDQFLAGATRAQIDGLNTIVRSFVLQMNDALNGQFLQLGQTMTEINQNAAENALRVDERVAAAAAVVTEVQRLQQMNENILIRFEDWSAAFFSKGEQDARFREDSAALLQEQGAALRALQNYQTQLQAALDRFAKDAAAQGHDLAESGTAMRDAAAGLTKSYSEFVGEVVRGVNEANAAFEQHLVQVIDRLSAALERGSAEVGEIAGLQRAVAELTQTVKKAEAELKPDGGEAQ